MSFTSDIRQEIANVDLEKHCQRAQLSALIQLTSSLTLSNGGFGIAVRTESATCARRIVLLLKELYDADTNVEVARKSNLKKNNVYRIRVEKDGRKILEDLGLYSSRGLEDHPSYGIVMKNCCASAYLAGAFLAYGSCNDPQNPGYHLEISLAQIEHANFVLKLLSRFQIEAKVAIRRNRYVVYLKKADYISDFLSLIKAYDARLRFEDERIGRDMKNSLSRIDNCEIANEVKTIRAGEKQVAYINRIIENGKYDKLPEKLKNVAQLRLANPESSLLDLCDSYQKAYGEVISKSGMKHRLNKLESYADSLEVVQ